jgi:hypothetical protein
MPVDVSLRPRATSRVLTRAAIQGGPSVQTADIDLADTVQALWIM